MRRLASLAWLPLALPGLLPGGPIRPEPLPPPGEGHLLALGGDLCLVRCAPGRVFAAFGGEEPRLAALGEKTGPAWFLPLSAEPSELAAAGPDTAALGDADGGVYLVRGDGTVLFAGGLPGGGPVRFATIEAAPDGKTALFGLGRESMALLEPATTRVSAPLTLPLAATSPPAAVGTTLIYGAGETVVALDIDGTELWRHRTGGSLTVAPVALGGMVFFACGDNRLYGFSPDSPAAPLVEYHELEAPPSALYPLPQGGLAVGLVTGELLFFRDGAPAGRVSLGRTPRPGAVLRGRELVLPIGWDTVAALNLAGTPFDALEPGEGPVTVSWVFTYEAGLRGGAALYAPRAEVKLTDEQRSRLALYLAGRDGGLAVLSRGH